jgi:galactokinase
VNLVGEHTDYNDGLVLPFALPMTTTASVTANDSGKVTVTSDGADDPVTFDVDASPDDVSGWAAYVAGVVWGVNRMLADGTAQGNSEATGITGLDIAIRSGVPIGAGLSSSAALECSVACAINDELGLNLEKTTIADLARRAENDFVGVPTGVMDQLASMLCEEHSLLYLDCRSMQTRLVPFDPSAEGLRLLVINTHAEHELAGSAYGERRQSCEEAAAALELASLRDATLEQVRSLSDQVLQRRAHHVVTEIERVTEVVELLESGRVADIGGFLTASHQSLRDDYEVSCPELDVTVDASLSAGALGARMTGGGFGGCAIVLCRDSEQTVVEESVRVAYAERDWQEPTIWTAAPARGAAPIEPGQDDGDQLSGGHA